MIHHLKTWPTQFEAVLDKRKSHEVRSTEDRTFTERDLLFLEEWDPLTETYTGRRILRTVSYVTPGTAWGLPANVCVMSIR